MSIGDQADANAGGIGHLAETIDGERAHSRDIQGTGLSQGLNLSNLRQDLGKFQARLPGAEAFYDQVLALPLFPAMTDEDVGRVVQALGALRPPRA